MHVGDEYQHYAFVPRYRVKACFAEPENHMKQEDEWLHVAQQLSAVQAIVSPCLSFDGGLILDLPDRDVEQSPLCAALTHVARFLTRNAEKWHIPESVEEQI